MKTLYFDCFAGASGNMILGALVALGVEREKLIEQIKLLDVSDFAVEFSDVVRSGISAVHADVRVPHEHAHRHLSTIEKIIDGSRLSEPVKTRALSIFTKLAEAEAKIHGIAVEKVHFHEVGAMDAIIDVVGACIGFEMLGVEKFVCSKIHVGSGFAEMAHGKFPIPPPAVAELLRGAPVYSTEIEGELITPTGAAIIAAVCRDFGQIPEMRIEKTAYGAGTREYEKFPNVLRLILGEEFSGEDEKRRKGEKEKTSLDADDRHNEQLTTIDEQHTTNHERRSTNHEHLILIETNLDDLSPQILGFVMERAFELGALDCWFTPIQMKKNRPATLVSILCERSKKEILTGLLYRETTTLGVRVRDVERECLPREIVRIETEFGPIDVKIARYEEKIVNAKPEYEQMREVAVNSNVSLREIEKKILEKIREKEIGQKEEN